MSCRALRIWAYSSRAHYRYPHSYPIGIRITIVSWRRIWRWAYEHMSYRALRTSHYLKRLVRRLLNNRTNGWYWQGGDKARQGGGGGGGRGRRRGTSFLPDCGFSLKGNPCHSPSTQYIVLICKMVQEQLAFFTRTQILKRNDISEKTEQTLTKDRVFGIIMWENYTFQVWSTTPT